MRTPPTSTPSPHPLHWPTMFLAWLVALLATAGALFLGEVMGMTPCVLCWYQRIAMFPLVLVLGIALVDGDARGARYSLPLAWVGWAIALYHCLVFWGVISEALSPCSSGGSCASADLQVAGFLPIPLMSLAAFTIILALLYKAQRKQRT